MKAPGREVLLHPLPVQQRLYRPETPWSPFTEFILTLLSIPVPCNTCVLLPPYCLYKVSFLLWDALGGWEMVLEFSNLGPKAGRKKNT